MTGIRNAAAGIVFRGDGDEVLLCKRNAQLKFMPGSWVFPGGRIDDREGTQHVVGAADEQQAIAIHAACREIFEESGLLCVEGRLPSDDEAHAARLRVLENPAEFDVFNSTAERPGPPSFPAAGGGERGSPRPGRDGAGGRLPRAGRGGGGRGCEGSVSRRRCAAPPAVRPRRV